MPNVTPHPIHVINPSLTGKGIRYFRLASWLLLLPVVLYIYFHRADAVRAGLQNAMSASLVLGYAVYLLMGCIRGFTLIPSTNLVLLGIPFLPPLPLFVLTLIGILVSSVSIYYFSESLHLDEFFSEHHGPRLARLQQMMQRHQMPIIIGWSFFPLAPTDLICYVCGVLKVDIVRFVVAVLVGEGAICAIYIFLGDRLMELIR
jgi:uncharacterized membrane protein YdjX (TVP38/TMEM64 family)